LTGATPNDGFLAVFQLTETIISEHTSILAKTNKIQFLKAYREENVFLVLVDGSRVRDGIGVFQYRHALTYTYTILDNTD